MGACGSKETAARQPTAEGETNAPKRHDEAPAVSTEKVAETDVPHAQAPPAAEEAASTTAATHGTGDEEPAAGMPAAGAGAVPETVQEAEESSSPEGNSPRVAERRVSSAASITALQDRISRMPKISSPRRNVPEPPSRSMSVRVARSDLSGLVSGSGSGSGRPGSAGRASSGSLNHPSSDDGNGPGAGGTVRGGSASSRGFALHRAVDYLRRSLDCSDAPLPAEFDLPIFLADVAEQWCKVDPLGAGVVSREDLARQVWLQLRAAGDPEEMPSPPPPVVQETVDSVMAGSTDGESLTFFDLVNLRLAEYGLFVAPPRKYTKYYSHRRALGWLRQQLFAKVADRDEAELNDLVESVRDRWALLDLGEKGEVSEDALRHFVNESSAGSPEELEATVASILSFAAVPHRLTFWEFTAMVLSAAGIDVALRPN